MSNTETATKFAHEVVPHLREGETKPLDYLVRYHYAQAQGWYLAFTDRALGLGAPGVELGRALANYLAHAHLAFLHDALAQGMGGQEAADWALVQHHSESAEIVYERGMACGLDLDSIKAYES